MKDYKLLKTCLVYLIFFIGVISAQEKEKLIFLEHNSIIADTSQKEILSYKIPYKNLLFTKKDDVYSSSFTLTLEFYKKEEFVMRDIVEQNLSIISYDESSSKSKYYQNFIDFQIPPGDYELKSFLSLEGTDLEYKIPIRKLKIENLSDSTVLRPIIIKSENSTISNNSFPLANFGMKIPFSPNKYDLLLGINNPIEDSVTVMLTQVGEEIYRNRISKIKNGKLSFEKVDEEILISIDDSSNTDYFYISNFSHLLYEGKTKLTVIIDTTEHNFDIYTAWIGKPDILKNPEYSIKILGYVAEDETIGELLSADEEDYYKNLTEYWIENFPTNGMKFNYAMEEFYKRSDHAVKNYSSLNSFDGAERDRGEVYILYGPPSSLDRNYTEMNEVVEVWTYKKTGREFVFKDVSGTGKFDLVQ